jgi:hypothetical protein
LIDMYVDKGFLTGWKGWQPPRGMVVIYITPHPQLLVILEFNQ